MIRRALTTTLEATESSDAALLASVAAGDIGALGTLYDRHAADVWRVVHRVTSGSGDVEDLVHTTFLKLPQLASSFDGRSSCRNWLCGIAVRLALRRSRSLRRFAGMLLNFSLTTEDRIDADPEGQADLHRDLAKLERALGALPMKKRAVFVLVELRGIEHQEVAEALGIPLATVRTRLFSAKHALRMALNRGRQP